jgi:hypothetical protein
VECAYVGYGDRFPIDEGLSYEVVVVLDDGSDDIEGNA